MTTSATRILYNSIRQIDKNNYESIKKYEQDTTTYSAIAMFVGILTGAFRMGFGCKQALVWGIYDGIVANCKCLNSKNNKAAEIARARAWVHFKHGLGNIIAGFIDMIPVIALIVLGLRHCVNPIDCQIMDYPTKLLNPLTTMPYANHFQPKCLQTIVQ